MGKGWIAEAKSRVRVTDAAAELGIKVEGSRLRPCPLCQADSRSSNERRAPVNLIGEEAWKCHACGDGADVVGLVAAVLTGSLQPAEWAEVKAWFAERGVASAKGGSAKGKAAARGGGWGRRTSSQGSGRGKARAARSGGGGAGVPVWRDGLARECAEALWSDRPEAVVVREYLTEVRKLPKESVRAFSLGLLLDERGKPVVVAGRPWLAIPLLDKHGRAVNMRARSVPVVGTCEHCDTPAGCRKCKAYRVTAKGQGRPMPLYGSHLLTQHTSVPVLVVEGELDVVAMHAYGFDEHVVSGTLGGGNWSEEWLDELEPFDELIGIEDDDDAGREGWLKVSSALGLHRCSRTKLPRKDAGECLADGVSERDVTRAIGNHVPMHGVRVVSVGSFLHAIESVLENPDQLVGVSTGSELLDSAIGGIRPGLVLVTGETGQGKSTFLLWLLWSLAGMGHRCLVSSFEGAAATEDGRVRPVAAQLKFLRMELERDPLSVSKETRRRACDQLDELPLDVIDHHGHMPADKLLQVFEQAARRQGTRYMLADHLGFLVDQDADDERREIDRVIRACADLANRLAVTIFLVAHPGNWIGRHRGKRTRPKGSDIKGASSPRQDADDLLVVQACPAGYDERGRKCKRPYPITIVEVDKSRSDFGGHAGTEVRLAFDPGSLHYADTWEETPSGRAERIVPHRPSRGRATTAGATEDEASSNEEQE